MKLDILFVTHTAVHRLCNGSPNKNHHKNLIKSREKYNKTHVALSPLYIAANLLNKLPTNWGSARVEIFLNFCFTQIAWRSVEITFLLKNLQLMANLPFMNLLKHCSVQHLAERSKMQTC